MTRDQEILKLINSDDEYLSRRSIDALFGWLGDRSDQELVEILRCSAATLAYRSCTNDDADTFVKPTGEVFITALRRISETFAKHIDESESK